MSVKLLESEIPEKVRQRLNDSYDLPALAYECVRYGQALVALDTATKYELGALLRFIKRHKIYKHYHSEKKLTWESFLAQAFGLERRTADNYIMAYEFISWLQERGKQFPVLGQQEYEKFDPSLLLLVQRPLREAIQSGDEARALGWLEKARTLSRAALKEELKASQYSSSEPHEFLVWKGGYGKTVMASSWGEALAQAPELSGEDCLVIERPVIRHGKHVSRSDDQQTNVCHEPFASLLRAMRSTLSAIEAQIAAGEYVKAAQVLDELGEQCSELLEHLSS